MYYIEKKFSIPIGHRLYLNKNRCQNPHGHNFSILVGIKSEEVNNEGMVMDFTVLKEICNKVLDKFDHAFMLNSLDEELIDLYIRRNFKVIVFDGEPTAENLSCNLYNEIEWALKNYQFSNKIYMDYVTVYENENSKATYRVS